MALHFAARTARTCLRSPSFCPPHPTGTRSVLAQAAQPLRDIEPAPVEQARAVASSHDAYPHVIYEAAHPRLPQHWRDYLQIAGVTVGVAALTFQVTVLFPWHEEISDQVQELRGVIEQQAQIIARLQAAAPAPAPSLTK